MNKLFAYPLLALCLLAAACKKESKVEAIEKKLVGTWLLKGLGIDKNANHIYDKEERDSTLVVSFKNTIRFNEDHSYVVTLENFGNNPPQVSSPNIKWEIREQDLNTIHVISDTISFTYGIEELNQTELTLEFMPTTITTFQSFTRQ